LLFISHAFAQGAGSLKALDDPLPDFPPGSINSVERSHRAEEAAAAAAKRQELRYAERRKACYKDFFAERCLSAARDEDHQLRSRISALELEARDFRRREDADRTAKSRDEREARQKEKERARREQKDKQQG